MLQAHNANVSIFFVLPCAPGANNTKSSKAFFDALSNADNDGSKAKKAKKSAQSESRGSKYRL